MHDSIVVNGNSVSFNGKTYVCAVGKNGFSADKKEGDGCTPLGNFFLRECWYRADKIPAPRTNLPLLIIEKNDCWCDDINSSEYNKHIKIEKHEDDNTNERAKKPSPSGRGLGEGFYHYLAPEFIQKARELRHLSTTPEQALWSILRNRQMQGYKFRRQHPIPPYITDFCCEEIKMIIEVDGNSHFSEEGIIHDAKRTAYLQQLGYRTMRFTNLEIMTNLEGVYEALTLTLSQREREHSHEKLWRDDHVYDLIIPLGYNDNPVIKNKGSAIFMHIAHEDYRGTEGCIALAQKDLLEILSKCDNNTQICINS